MIFNTLAKPIMIDARNVEANVTPFQTLIDDVNVEELFRNLLGDGKKRVNLVISLMPVEPQKITILTGTQKAEAEELWECMEVRNEQLTEEVKETDSEEQERTDTQESLS